MKQTKEFKFSNGDKVEDKVTGFSGTITGTCFYITGCNQYLVAGKQHDKSREALSKWYDEQRLNLLEEQVVDIDNSDSGDGPDLPAPIK